MQKYDHYVAVDWSKNNMAIAKMTNHSDIPKVVDVQTDVEDLKVYLKQLKGSVILTRMDETSVFKRYYEELIKNKNYPEFNARHALARMF